MKIRALASRSASISKTAAASAPRPTSRWRSAGRWSASCWSKRQIIGASIGQFAGNTVLVFFLTWFPTWLATERHMPWLKVGFFSILPFVAAAGG
ncbi:hypothetical protein LNP24_09110 [Klebsiella pneumoniae subsp. pneumoniae]|nr:hypothetical protein [Klebsiella pneumoniae subsp. pneumoniae]